MAGEYLASLVKRREGVATQFNTALGEVGRQEGQSATLLGTLPGQFDNIYKQSNDTLAAGAGAMEQAQQKAGLSSLMPSSAVLAPLQAASAQQQAGARSTVPLLQAGFADTYARQRGSLDQARLGQLEGIDQEEATFLAEEARRAEEARLAQEAEERDRAFREQQAESDREFQREESRASRAHDAASAAASRAGSKSDWEAQMAAEEAAQIRAEGRERGYGQADAATVAREGVPGGTKTPSYLKGRYLLDHDPKTAAKIKGEPQYKSLEKKLLAKGFKPGETEKARKFLLEESAGKPWDRTLSILMASYSLDDSGLDLVSLLPAKSNKSPHKGYTKGKGGGYIKDKPSKGYTKLYGTGERTPVDVSRR